MGIKTKSFGAKAIVNFDGVNSVTVRESFNVASVSYDGNSKYTTNFINPLPNTGYSVLTGGMGNTSQNVVGIKGSAGSPADLKTTTQLQVQCRNTNGSVSEITEVSIGIF